jgi:hypothetical protein
MHRILLCSAALLLAPVANAAILYQTTLDAGGGAVFFDDSITVPWVTQTGSTWIEISGGTLSGASWDVFGDFSKYWWEIVGVDEDDNPIYFLNGNEYIYSNGCTVTTGAPACSNTTSFRAQMNRNSARVDFIAPVSFNTCFPFNGILYVDCAANYNLAGAQFFIAATGPGDVTLTIHDSPFAGAVPEPESWALLIAGFGVTGAALRRRRAQAATRARAA